MGFSARFTNKYGILILVIIITIGAEFNHILFKLIKIHQSVIADIIGKNNKRLF